MLISAHGNSLRAMKKYLENMSDVDIMKVNIPTGEFLQGGTNTVYYCFK